MPASPASRTVVAGANGQQARQRREAKARGRGKKGRLPHPSALLAGCIAPMRTGKLRDTSTRGGIRERGLRAANGWCGLTSHRADSYTKHRARGFIRAKPVRVSTASRVAGHASSRRGDSCTLPRPLLACARAPSLSHTRTAADRGTLSGRGCVHTARSAARLPSHLQLRPSPSHCMPTILYYVPGPSHATYGLPQPRCQHLHHAEQ